MQNQTKPKSKFRNLIIVLVVNAVILGYLEFGISDEDRYHDAIEAYQEGNYFKTYNLMTRLANDENVDAQAMLASLYFEGKGVDADKEQAIFWYQKAAEHGNAEAIAFIENNKTAFQE